MERRAWNPWAALRARPHVTLRRVDLPAECGGAVWWPAEDRSIVLLDRALLAVERNEALAHELVHDERGGHVDDAGMPETWAAVRGREETTVDRIVAERLLPADELASWVATMVGMGEPVTARAAADEFGVTIPVAERALRRLEGEAA